MTDDTTTPPIHEDLDLVRAMGHRMIDLIVDELAAPDRRPIYPPRHTRDSMEALFGGPLPETGTAAEDLLDVVRDAVIPASANYLHPRLLGYVSSTPLPIAGMLEGLIGAIRLFPYNWASTPACTHIETVTVRWLGQLTGYDDNAAGYVTTGGTWANMMGLALARHHRAGWDVQAEGLGDRPRLVAYVSSEGHACIEQSVRLLGIGANQLRRIGVDDDHRIRVDLLADAIRADLDAGLRPFCVVGVAGATNTGVVDRLDALADVAQRHGLWFHVDGAYGALAASLDDYRPLFAGIERADSLVVDPHKWLNSPYDAGCLLTKDWQSLSDTFSILPDYLRAGHDAGEHHHWQHGFELTRTDRALKIWFSLRQHGAANFRRMFAEHLDLARRATDWLDAAPDFEVVIRPMLSAVGFRYIPEGRATPGDAAYIDSLNQAIEEAMIADGSSLIPTSTLNGRPVFRMCIVNHRATWSGVVEALEFIRRLGHDLHQHRAK